MITNKSVPASTITVYDSGLIRLRQYGPLSRRSFGYSLAGAGAAAMLGLSGTGAVADANVAYMGWQDYDTGLNVDGWLETNGVTLEPTYIGTNEEIIAAGTAGGVGTLDLCTPAVIYLDIYEQADILEPLDLDRIPNWDLLFLSCGNSSRYEVTTRSLLCHSSGATCP